MRETVVGAASQVTNTTGQFRAILAGLSNVYTHYITTFEEYQVQRYEAASTIFGPHTLLAYQQQYIYLLENMLLVSY